MGVRCAAELVDESEVPGSDAAQRVRFLGLGDSLTQGVGDPRPGYAGFAGELSGWVSYFSTSVEASGQPVEVRNFASAGARLAQVIDEQVPPAMSKPADIISCLIGINDLWDVNIDLDEFGQRFDTLFRELSFAAPIVITASIHDVFAPFPVRAPLRDKLARNTATMNEIIRGAVADYRLVLLDLASRADMFTSAVRAVDRLHPNRYGHQLIAGEVVAQLHNRGHLLDVQPPAARPKRRGAQDLAHIAWVGGYVRHNWKRWRVEMADAKARESTPPSVGTST